MNAFGSANLIMGLGSNLDPSQNRTLALRVVIELRRAQPVGRASPVRTLSVVRRVLRANETLHNMKYQCEE